MMAVSESVQEYDNGSSKRCLSNQAGVGQGTQPSEETAKNRREENLRLINAYYQ